MRRFRPAASASALAADLDLGWFERSLNALPRPVDVVVRDDDITCLSPVLAELLRIARTSAIPLHLAVIPSQTSPEDARQIAQIERESGGLIELGQHGWNHANHGSRRRPYEFGPRRSADQQHHDIARGQALMGELFGALARPVFTPPYYGFDRTTLAVMASLNFQVFSGGPARSYARRAYPFTEVSVNIDPIAAYLPRIRYKPPQHLLAEMLQAARSTGYLGIVLHHDLLPADWLALLERLFPILAQSPQVRLQHMSAYAASGASPRPWRMSLTAWKN